MVEPDEDGGREEQQGSNTQGDGDYENNLGVEVTVGHMEDDRVGVVALDVGRVALPAS